MINEEKRIKQREYEKRYRERNKEILNEKAKKRMKEFASKNPEIIKQRNKRTYDSMKESGKIKELRKILWNRTQELMDEVADRPRPLVCEICFYPKRKIVFDHCHNSDTFRGWICNPCNTALGLMSNSVLYLQNMIDYLIVHSKKKDLKKIPKLLSRRTKYKHADLEKDDGREMDSKSD